MKIVSRLIRLIFILLSIGVFIAIISDNDGNSDFSENLVEVAVYIILILPSIPLIFLNFSNRVIQKIICVWDMLGWTLLCITVIYKIIEDLLGDDWMVYQDYALTITLTLLFSTMCFLIMNSYWRYPKKDQTTKRSSIDEFGEHIDNQQ